MRYAWRAFLCKLIFDRTNDIEVQALRKLDALLNLASRDVVDIYARIIVLALTLGNTDISLVAQNYATLRETAAFGSMVFFKRTGMPAYLAGCTQVGWRIFAPK